MTRSLRRPLPAGPLLRAYVEDGLPSLDELGRLVGLGARFQAVRAARHTLLAEPFVDSACAADFEAALLGFYSACVQPPLHAVALHRGAGIVRHGVSHLLRSADAPALKLGRCLDASGPYFVPGLGPAFWSAVVQGLDPLELPAWTPSTVEGLTRLGLVGEAGERSPTEMFEAIRAVYRRLRAHEPKLTALHLDHFLARVALMEGRDLGARDSARCCPAAEGLRSVLQQERVRLPLRRRLKEQGHAFQEARTLLEAGLAARDGRQIGTALASADPVGARRAPVRWAALGETLTLWVGRLWEADDVWPILDAFWQADPIRGAGLWLPAAVLHLKDPRQFHCWNDAIRQGWGALDDSADLPGPPALRYQLFNEGIAALCVDQRVHPLEVADVLAQLDSRSPGQRPRSEASAGSFGGFCADTFRFLEELGRNNCRAWMEANRDRYQFAVRGPLAELCRALAQRYVGPVLRGEHGWDLETAAQSGRALTSICKNDYGRSVPYHTALWITFYRRSAWEGEAPASGAAPRKRAGKRDEAQFFVRLDATGLTYGLRIGKPARAAGVRFRRNVQEHADMLFRALTDAGALPECRCGRDEDWTAAAVPSGPDELRAWAAGKSWILFKEIAPAAHVLASDELVGEILRTFNALVPAYACAAEPAPRALLARRAGSATPSRFESEDFLRATFLDPDWLRRARDLLGLKRQLILQGVPGTGKTHVARCLGRLLTGGREEGMRLVQFHPAYSYEEFVEGIKVKSLEVNGRHDVVYPVEDGLLCSFAAEAARRPAEPHVLIIDEINRGNLPRIFGELLYLLEYRGQAVDLPYSRRGFRLPANLYLIGTMNAADRSVALLDQALRRRFSFLEMAPEAAILRAWLREHPPRAGAAFVETVVDMFERLNDRLGADLGPQARIGHSYFMVPELDEARLRVVWEHHVQPVLEEHAALHPGRAATSYPLEQFLGEKPSRKSRPAKTPGLRT